MYAIRRSRQTPHVRRRRRKLAVTLYAVVALATTGAVLALWSGDVLRSTDLRTVDARFSIRGEHAAPDVVVVGIDARTNRSSPAFRSGARCTRGSSTACAARVRR